MATTTREPIETADLLEIEWPARLVPEILASLLEGDLSSADEELVQRRLVMGTISPRAGDDETGGVDLLTSVLRACLTFAGRRLSWRAVSHSRAKRRSSRASSWCACAVRVLRRAISPDYATAYDVFREQLVRFPGLCAATLAAHDRETTDRSGFDYGPHAWPFVLLAAASSTRAADATSRKAANAFETSLRKLRRDEMDAMFSSWFAAEEPRRRLLEQCVARPAGGLAAEALPALAAAWPACRGVALAHATSGLARGDAFESWVEAFERLAADWSGGLSEEEERAVTEATTRLSAFAATRGPRAAARVARAATRVAVASRSAACESKLLEEARAAIDAGGDSARCGAFVASELLALGRVDDARATLERAVSRGDESARRAGFEAVAERVEAMGDCRAIAADAAGVVARVAGGLFQSLDDRPGDAADAAGVSASSLRALPAAMRVVVRHARGASDVGAAIESVRAVRRAFARGKDAEATRENASSFVALAASIETLLDEAAILPSDAARLFPSASDPSETDENYLLDLVETHAALAAKLRGVDASALGACRARVAACASLLDVASSSMAFEAEHRAHVVAVAARCVRDASSPANVVFEDGVEGAVARCAKRAAEWWRAWTSDAEATLALRLLRECARFAVAAGGDAPGELFARITTEEERVRAARAVATRANSALGKNKYEAVGRAARDSPACGAVAMFCEAAHEHDARPGGLDVAAAALDVVGTLEPACAAEATGYVAFVLDASMSTLRDVIFSARGADPALATRATEVVAARRRETDSAAERAVGLADVLFEAAPHVARGDLSDATAALLREMERTLRALASREDDASDANARRATTDAAAATQEVVNAILVFSRARRKGAVRNGRGKDDAAPSTSSPESSSTFRLAVPAVGCARRCLEAATREASRAEGDPEDDPLFAAAADLRRAVEILLRRRILPDEISRALEPWHRELFFERARAANAMGASAEKVSRTQTTLAGKVDWQDDWPERGDVGAANAREPAGARDAGLARQTARRPLAAKQKKKKRKRKELNPFVEALKESEGKGKSRASDWDDLSDFVVCKPGRDYRRLLGLDEQRARSASPRPKPSRDHDEDGRAPKTTPKTKRYRRVQERSREQLVERAAAGTLGEPDEGVFFRGARNSLWCMRCKMCLTPSLKKKCELLESDENAGASANDA